MLAVHVLCKEAIFVPPLPRWECQVPVSTSPAGQPNTFLPLLLQKPLNASLVFIGPASIIK